MKKLTSLLASWLSKKSSSNKDYEIIEYGIYAFFIYTINIVSIIIISINYSKFFESIIFIISFFFLRKDIGGIHLKSPYSCLLFGILLWHFFMLILTDILKSNLICCIFLIIISFIIIKCTPVSQKEIIRNYRMKRKIYLKFLVCLIIIAISCYLKLNIYIYIILGMTCAISTAFLQYLKVAYHL